MTTTNKCRVASEVESDYLRSMLPRNASEKKSESWDDTMKDVERTILPSITYWQHSRFHACFSAGNSYP
ncbi:unnamed protein product [Rotaria sordida]|uniref:Uncharacterized protein n=1 Tax=Rotaria sordida TaxID=392033 RepID=A0A819W8Q0_9BILA|nr:unnamed protein product [Rotaria sordida]CAF4176800.1 unnamed protein product [Rotaria sordida]